MQINRKNRCHIREKRKIPQKNCKKAGTQSRACTSNTGGPQPTAVAHTGQPSRAWGVISGSVDGCSGPQRARTPLPLREGVWGGRGVHLQAQVDIRSGFTSYLEGFSTLQSCPSLLQLARLARGCHKGCCCGQKGCWTT